MRTSLNPRRPLLAVATLAAASLLAGCSLLGYAPTPLPGRLATPQPTAAAPTTPATCTDALASYAPDGALPKAGEMPSGSTMRKIQDRGRLIAGVSADTFLLGSHNPLNGRVEGFDIDMVKAVAKAIFGDETKYELKVITAAQRIPSLQNGSVDIVARNMTINCDRWTQIAFSSEYYRSGQKILVRRGSKATSIADLAGQKVCAPKSTSSMDNLIKRAPKAIPVGADNHTGCLVLFQQGEVAAITGDDTVLAGFSAQDPYAKVIGDAFTSEPYGLGTAPNDVDFTRFVNFVLEDMRKDGTLTALTNKYMKGTDVLPAVPKAVYGRDLEKRK